MTLEIFQQLALNEASFNNPSTDCYIGYVYANSKKRYESMLQDINFQMRHITGSFNMTNIVKYHLAIFADEATDSQI